MPIPLVAVLVPLAQITAGAVPPSPPATSPATAAPAPTSARVVSLEESTQSALKRQPQLRQARAATSAAVARGDQASSGRLPQIVGTAQYLRETGNFALRPGATLAGGAVPPWSSTTYNFYNFAVTATQLIYDFGQTPDRAHAARANADAFRESERTTEVAIVLAVRRAFFTARAQRDLVKVASENLANQANHLVQIQGFVAVGTRPEIDLAQSKTDVANARVQVILAQNAYDVAKAQLAQATGAEAGLDFDVADDDLPPVPDEDAPTEALLARAFAARPELATIERQRRAGELTVRSAKGAYGPTLAATGFAQETGIALDGLVPNWGVGATLTWPILQGGLTRGVVDEAQANLEGLDAQSEVVRLQVRFDLENARLSLRAAKATIVGSDEALANAKERLRLAEGRYQAGVGSAIELGDAQIALANAAAQVVQAHYNLATARAQLLAALGRR